MAKRLAGRPARNASDVMLAAQTRAFGLIYEDTPGQVGLRAAEALEKALRRVGVELLDSVGFSGGGHGSGDGLGRGPQGREPAAPGRRRPASCTSGDGLFPVFMTQEATRQGYGPEWVLLGPSGAGGAGDGLTDFDTTFSGRTYDQTQWAHAFGLSFSGARLAPGQGEAWRIHAWHTGHAPPARASHALHLPGAVDLLHRPAHGRPRG